MYIYGPGTYNCAVKSFVVNQKWILLGALAGVIMAWISDSFFRVGLSGAFFLLVMAFLDEFILGRNPRYVIPGKGYLLLLFLLTLIPRLYLFDLESGDYTSNLSLWFDILKNEGFSSLRNDFHSYPPSYLYLMYGMTLTGIQKLWAIKIISVAFDYLLAFAVFRIVVGVCGRRIGTLAAVISLMLPTVMMNGALWGQSDSIYTSFLLLSLGSFMRGKGNSGMIWYAVAFVFKVQALFFILVPLYFYLSKQVRLHTFLLIPLFFAISVVPNWLVGRGFADLMLLYTKQTGLHDALSLFAPNVYQWMAWAPTFIFTEAGIAFTGALVGLFCLLVYRRPIRLGASQLLQLALLSTLLVPFFLPRMHDRYFFPADVLALVYAFFFPKRWFIPVLVCGASFFAYLYFLFSTLTVFPFSILAAMMGIALFVVLRDFLHTYLNSIKNGYSAESETG